MEIRTRLTSGAALLSGLIVAACAVPYSEYDTYSGYRYPPSYYSGYPPGYYAPGAYGSLGYYDGFWDRRAWRGRPGREDQGAVQRPQPSPPASSGGFLGNVERRRQAAPPSSPGDAQSGSSQSKGFLGNVLRKRQEQSQ